MTKQKSGILVVVDPAESNDRVLQRAQDLAKRFDTHLELFSCTYNPYFSGERIYETRAARKAKAQHIVEEKNKLDELASTIEQSGHETKTDVCWDIPEYEAVIRKVMRTNPMMVLRAGEYHNAIDRALMSNDDWNLIRNCPAPVLMVRKDVNEPRSGIIWAAVDPMHEHDKPAVLDDEIIKEARMLAETSDSVVHLIHVYDSAAAIAAMAAGAVASEMFPSKEIGEQVRDNHLQRLTELADKHDIEHGNIHNIPGVPRLVLPALANDRKPDVIVLGAVNRGFFKRLLIGSTAEKILDKLPCDLCVVKPEGFETHVSKESRHEFRLEEAASEEQGVA